MEKLNSDEKIMIFMNLSASEIVNMCKANKDLSRVCNDVRYNSLWIKKIKDDFSDEYRGNNAFEEYKRLYILLKTPIYTVDIRYEEDNNNTENYNFTNLEKSKQFLHLYFDENFREILKDSEDNEEGRDNIKYIEKEKKAIDDLELNSLKNIFGYYVLIYQSYLNCGLAYYK